MELYCENWSAWLPDKYFDAKSKQLDISKAPDISFIPPMQRRRLSELDKISIFTANKILESCHQKNIKTIFATQHGELTRTFNILENIAIETEVSPTEFSTSVHNTSPGVFSILNQITQGSTTLSASQNTFHAGLVETFIQLNNSNQPIILTIADEKLPDLVLPYTESKNIFSISFLFTPIKTKSCFTLKISNTHTINEAISAIELPHKMIEILCKKYDANFFVNSFGSSYEVSVLTTKETL